MKIKYRTKPISNVTEILGINYGCKIIMKDGNEVHFTLSEMNTITRMWKDFKKQSGFKKI